MTTRPETPQVTFDNITKTYGSFDNYLHDGLKLSDSDLAGLLEELLEPQSLRPEFKSQVVGISLPHPVDNFREK